MVIEVCMDVPETNINIHDFTKVREFFSHNIRTATAMVVATAMVFKYNLCDEEESGVDIISESAYFLDVYDKGMDICFDFILGKPISKDFEEISPTKIIRHFESKIPLTIKEQGANLEINLDEFSLKSNAHIVKAILEIVLCQEIRNAKGEIVISSKNGVYSIKNHEPIGDFPEIYSIFQKLLNVLDIKLSYSNNNIILRFL